MPEVPFIPRSRKKIPLARQVRVLFRDMWLCHLCGYPTVFPLALKYLQRFVARNTGPAAMPAYYDFRYRHDAAPMLDYLACVIDHRIAHARGGSVDDDNLVTACNKCNVRKSDREYVEYMLANPRRKVKGRYGPPERWDGLASVFIALAKDYEQELTANERAWLKELRAYYSVKTAEAGA